MSALPGVAVHQQLAIHRGMIEASSHVGVTIQGDRLVATCSICDGQRTFHLPTTLWDVLDMMGHHYRSNHVWTGVS